MKGDKNTGFFHKKTNRKRKRNTIGRIKDRDGEWKVENHHIQQIMTDVSQTYFWQGAFLILMMFATLTRGNYT